MRFRPWPDDYILEGYVTTANRLSTYRIWCPDYGIRGVKICTFVKKRSG